MSSPVEPNLSPKALKPLFYIWFNSISNDGKSLNITQFSTIMNRIFASTSTLSQRQIYISQIFNQLSNNSDVIRYNEFLSKNDDIFIDIMIKLLEGNFTALSTLQSVPNLCVNNPSNNTLQQILCEQSQKMSELRELNSSSYNLLGRVARLDMELDVLSEEKGNLQTDQDIMTRSFSNLNEDYTSLVEQISVLKSFNRECKLLNETLQSSLDSVQKDLFNQQEICKQQNDIIENLTKLKLLNQQNKETIHQLMLQKDQQSKKIMNLSTINQQVQVAMESAATALDQKTEQVNKLQRQLEILKLKPFDFNMDDHDDFNNDADEILRLTMADSSVRDTNISHGSRKSYIFTMHDLEHTMHETETATANTLYDHVSSPNSSTNSQQTVLLIGGGQPMALKSTSMNLDSKQSNYKKLYHDEKHGVDVYVSKDNQSDNDELRVLTDEASNESNESNKETIKYDSEIMKFRKHYENRNDIVSNLPMVKESISVEYKLNNEYLYDGYADAEDDNISLIDTKCADAIGRINEKENKSRKIPRGFNEQPNNSCVLFGCTLW